MNRRRVTMLTLVLLAGSAVYGLRPTAQQPIVDKDRSRQELDTMKSILETTLEYASKRVAPKQSETRDLRVFVRPDGGSIRAFYLYGQGAVFVIPASDVMHLDMDFAFNFDGVMAAIPDPEELKEITSEAVDQALADQADQSNQAEAQKERAEKQKLRAERQRERVQKMVEEQKVRMEKQREEMKKRRDEMNKQRENLQHYIDETKTYLRDTLANHGDSLSIVKPDESVTVVITAGGSHFPSFEDVEDDSCTVISVKKSLVTDLKAGKISREEFDRRVIDYTY